MDLPDVAPGAVICLPVNAPGALLTSVTATPPRATANSVAWQLSILP